MDSFPNTETDNIEENAAPAITKHEAYWLIHDRIENVLLPTVSEETANSCDTIGFEADGLQLNSGIMYCLISAEVPGRRYIFTTHLRPSMNANVEWRRIVENDEYLGGRKKLKEDGLWVPDILGIIDDIREIAWYEGLPEEHNIDMAKSISDIKAKLVDFFETSESDWEMHSNTV